jgi:hypothetical protein
MCSLDKSQASLLYVRDIALCESLRDILDVGLRELGVPALYDDIIALAKRLPGWTLSSGIDSEIETLSEAFSLIVFHWYPDMSENVFATCIIRFLASMQVQQLCKIASDLARHDNYSSLSFQKIQTEARARYRKTTFAMRISSLQDYPQYSSLDRLEYCLMAALYGNEDSQFSCSQYRKLLPDTLRDILPGTILENTKGISSERSLVYDFHYMMVKMKMLENSCSDSIVSAAYAFLLEGIK